MDMLSGEFVASLVTVSVPVSWVPSDVGVNFTLNVVVPFAASGIEPDGGLVSTKSAFPANEAALIVTVVLPVFVIVTGSVWLVVSGTLPKAKLMGLADIVMVPA
jgi:hypothetical protein